MCLLLACTCGTVTQGHCAVGKHSRNLAWANKVMRADGAATSRGRPTNAHAGHLPCKPAYPVPGTQRRGKLGHARSRSSASMTPPAMLCHHCRVGDFVWGLVRQASRCLLEYWPAVPPARAPCSLYLGTCCISRSTPTCLSASERLFVQFVVRACSPVYGTRQLI